MKNEGEGRQGAPRGTAWVLEGGCVCACKSLAFVRTSKGLEGGCFCACRSLAFVMKNKGEGGRGHPEVQHGF